MVRITKNAKPVKKEWIYKGKKTGVFVDFNIIDSDVIEEITADVSEGFNARDLNVRIAKKIISNWEGFIDEDNNALTSCGENIELVCNKIPDFALWVNNTARELTVNIVEYNKKN